ncbi:MAG: SagB/ThcOx family dehydrogenase [Candidatus Eisenbacteria bacterium]|nr:SagB/ThcOx family dehydrogenase [Candidatus Eisenbacteria bacterium]
MQLPERRRRGSLSVEEALARRRSRREFRGEPLSLDAVSSLLWAVQGQSSGEGLRTAPSAGACYPLSVYLIAGSVDGLDPGVYAYDPERHALTDKSSGDLRFDLAKACLGQECVQDAAAIVLLAAVYERTTSRYGGRGVRYVHMDVGFAGENLHLQAEALGLGTVVVGAFEDEEVQRVIGLADDEIPQILMPVGRPR